MKRTTGENKTDDEIFTLAQSEEKKRKNPKKDCNFITLNDFSMFHNKKIPSPDPTNFVLWYEKENTDKWGITLKKFEKSERFNSQYVWKCTWLYGDIENILYPSPGSTNMIEPITGADVDRLLNIKQKYIEKTANKKK